MGDCTIHLLIEDKLLFKPDTITADEPFRLIPSSHIISADSTLVELTTLLSRSITNAAAHSNDSILSSLCIIDASYYPACTVTSIIRSHPDVSGPNSKTLQSMGWFPSGKLVLLSLSNTNDDTEKAEGALLNKFIEWQSRHLLNEEEFGYNTPITSVTGGETKGVQWTGAGGSSDNAALKPTDIFNAIQYRFDNESSNIQQHDISTTNRRMKKRSEQQRHARLDAILSKLNSNKKTSIQVRNMLIKSRAVGDKKLRMEDRFHLEIVRINDTVDGTTNSTESSDYRFYSRQTTAGRIASSVFPSLGQERAAEFLISVLSNDANQQYKRLPNTTSLHDAQLKGWLNEFAVVLIRVYMLRGEEDSEGPSKSVLDTESDDKNVDYAVSEDMEIETIDREHNTITPTTEATSISNDALTGKDKNQSHLQHIILSIFQMAESGEIEKKSNDVKPRKKKKPVSKQIQNMLIKSKAKGNPKIKQEDRLYLAVIVFQDNNQEVAPSSLSVSYLFFERRKAVGHIIESLGVSTPTVDRRNITIEFIVQQSMDNDEKSFRILPTDMPLTSAIENKLLDNFNFVIVRVLDI